MKSLNISIRVGERSRSDMATAVAQVIESLRDTDNGEFDLGWRGGIFDHHGHEIGSYAVQGADKA